MTRAQKIRIRKIANLATKEALETNEYPYFVAREEMDILIGRNQALWGCPVEEAVDCYNTCIEQNRRRLNFDLNPTSKRNFKYRGEEYLVQNLGGEVEDGEKYFVSVRKGERWEICHNICGLDILTFKTIKEAQRYVRDNFYMITIL